MTRVLSRLFAMLTMVVVIGALLVAVTAASAVGATGQKGATKGMEGIAALSEYLAAHPTMSRQQKLDVSYGTHERRSFWIRSEAYDLEFGLAAGKVGLQSFGPAGAQQSLLSPRSINIVIEADDGTVYETADARKPARINIFRHGPHFYDVHVFDLEPTSGKKTLPIKGEVVFFAYPDRLYAAVRLYATAEVDVKSAAVEFLLPKAPGQGVLTDTVTASAPASVPLGDGSLYEAKCPFTTSLAIGSMGFIYGAQSGSSGLSVTADSNLVRVRQGIDLRGGHLTTGRPLWACWRMLGLPGDGSGTAAALSAEAYLETHPLSTRQFKVEGEGRFDGYVPSRGYYAISTAAGWGFNEPYADPSLHPFAPFTIRNDGTARRVYVQHSDSAHGGCLEGAAVTDTNGNHIPVLVQGSKNFCGENEEPFYDKGDTAYSESYFALDLDPGASLSLRSYHIYEGWGNHRTKQISSLQAWMPYYHMSTGMTETTCYVPFRFGGHLGIDIADLRGISGEIWDSQPQFDNAAGHRFFRYTDKAGQHAPNYLRTGFRLTSPNMASWSMDYETEGREARMSFDIAEVPQLDETRSLNHVRIEFDKALVVENPARNLQLVQIDTYTQLHKYGKVGYIGTDGKMVEVSTAGAGAKGQFVEGVALTAQSPMFALYDAPPESGQRCNNAVIVRSFSGLVGGKRLSGLTFSAKRFTDGNMAAWLTLPGTRVAFQPGDYIDLDLVVMPFGTTGSDATAAIKAREMYGLRPPTASATRGSVLSQFPCRVRVDGSSAAEFTLQGGSDLMPVLVEGFASYAPPVLERLDGTRWTAVKMTGEAGNEGHQAYLTAEGRFGFVFLVPSDGSTMQMRVR